MDQEIVQACAQTLYTPIPAMILEVAIEFTKLAAYSNFPHMFLRAKIHAQNSFEHDMDLVSWCLGRWKGSVHKSRKNKPI